MSPSTPSLHKADGNGVEPLLYKSAVCIEIIEYICYNIIDSNVRFYYWYIKMTYCLNCNTETSNPKFCSQSCSATFTNKSSHKRVRTNKCKRCNTPILSKHVYCSKCRQPDMTLNEAMTNYTKHAYSAAFNLVRSRARSILIKLKRTICEKCGYTKHFEACHKKPISSFSIDTLISIINDSRNLIPLCPNCHWEFDKTGRAGVEPTCLSTEH